MIPNVKYVFVPWKKFNLLVPYNSPIKPTLIALGYYYTHIVIIWGVVKLTVFSTVEKSIFLRTL